MKLSMSMLARALVKYEPEIHILRDAATIRGVRFLSDDRKKYALEYVYIGEASGYFEDQRYSDAMILVSGENQIICHSGELELLLNDILSAFDDYSEAEERLAMAASRQAPAAEIVEIAGNVIDGPCLVFDMRGQLIYGIHREFLPERIRLNLQNTGTLGVENMSQVLVDERGEVRHDISDEPLLLHPRDNDAECAVSMYLTTEGERVGYMMIFSENENDARIALQCEKWIGGFLSRAREFTDSASDHLAPPQVLRQFLECAQPSRLAIQRLMSETDTQPYMVLMAVKSIGARNDTVHHLLMADLKRMPMKCTACEYQDTVVILAGQRVEAGVLSFFRSQRWLGTLAVGVSMPVHHLSELAVAYEQALFAVNADTSGGIRRSSDYALAFLLRLISENKMSAFLRHPAISVLENYDAKNRTDLLMTLKTYLQQSCSQNRTAEALHVHLNSLKYRLRRIVELTGLNLHDSEELLYLQLSLRIGPRASIEPGNVC
jgi:hypothetical protein